MAVEFPGSATTPRSPGKACDRGRSRSQGPNYRLPARSHARLACPISGSIRVNLRPFAVEIPPAQAPPAPPSDRCKPYCCAENAVLITQRTAAATVS
jgi:hypothetical protein